ncbi:MAG: esterase family protein [Longimicrobiales bacterium]
MAKREYHRWHSPSLGRDMELLVFGHAGARVLVFPTSLGKFFEWEDRGMVAALSEHLENGWIQLFCLDSVDAESWYARNKHPGERAARHQQYERYVLDEVIPLAWQVNPNPFLIVAGASFGAYHALNLAFRYPQAINRVIGLSGLYDIKQILSGYQDPNVYVHDPSHYMIHESDPGRLEALRRMNIILAIGKEDPNLKDNQHLSDVLWSKGVWHAFRLWDGWAHDWPWWRQMIQQYIAGND